MQSPPVQLDATDERIMAELRRDARQSVTAIAQKCHISRAHAYSRINRLQDEGVILRYTALIDPVKAGLQASAYVTLKLRQHSWREMRERLTAIKQVHHIGLVGGNFDVILLVRAQNNAELRHVIFDQLQSMPGVLDTQTFLIFEDVDTR
ncbi:Lrp/AsnC family transcriptional regulator [Zhihengliuella alba]|uniref:Lrp/AsnC family transcriptional regulator n=1 Tax=Zhihengliuella alba TaxID=547018 RepID=A0ABP7DDA8_9MICC